MISADESLRIPRPVDIRTQATLLAAIVTLALAGAALLRDDRPRVFTLFAGFAANLGIYSLADFFHRWPGAELRYDGWERLAVVAGALLPATALAFFLEFLGVARRPARRARNAMLAGSLSGVVVAATPLVRLSLPKLVVTVYVVGGMIAVLSVLWGRMVAAPTRVERARLLYLFIGACVTVTLSTLHMLPRWGWCLWRFRGGACGGWGPARGFSISTRSPPCWSSCRSLRHSARRWRSG